MSFFKELESRIAAAMQADRYRLRTCSRRCGRRKDGWLPDDKLEKLLKQLDQSNQRRERGRALVPRLEYDETLPVASRRDEIAAAIRDFQVVVVCGETGVANRRSFPKSVWKLVAASPA
jgi:ATP-dependent helicase HrpA